MKRRVVPTLLLVWALVALVLASGTAQADLIQATATLTALGNTPPITSNTTIFTGTQAVSGGVEFSGTIGTADGGGPGATWSLDLSADGFTISTECVGFSGGASNQDCEYPSGLRLTLSGLTFSPAATLTGLAILTVTPDPEDPLSVSGTPQVTASSVIIDFQAYEKSCFSTPAETVFAAEFQVQPVVVATPLPGALVLVAIGGLGAAALAIRRARG